MVSLAHIASKWRFLVLMRSGFHVLRTHAKKEKSRGIRSFVATKPNYLGQEEIDHQSTCYSWQEKNLQDAFETLFLQWKQPLQPFEVNTLLRTFGAWKIRTRFTMLCSLLPDPFVNACVRQLMHLPDSKSLILAFL